MSKRPWKAWEMKLFVAGLLLMISGLCRASVVDSADQDCHADDDCRIVINGCGCLHNTACLGPEAKASAVISAVNKKFEKRYEPLSKCSESELKQCAVAGACFPRGTWQPKCLLKKCDVVFKKADFKR